MKTLLTINSAVLGAGITYFFTRSTVDEAVASRAALSAEVRQSKAEVGRLDGALKTQAQQAAALHQETLALQNALTKSLEYVPVAQKRVLMQQVKPLLEKSGDAQPPEAPRPEAPR